MSDFLKRNQLLLLGIQADAVTEATLTEADAIKVRQNLRPTPNFESIDTDYIQNGLDQSASITGGGSYGFDGVGCYLKGAGTAGEAPDYGKLMRLCGLSETIVGTAIAGTAQAGATGSITLAAGASASNDAYKGMVIRTILGTGPDQMALITGYNGTTKVATVTPNWAVTPDATTTYSIDKGVLYRPVSSGFEYGTAWRYLHRTDGGDSRRQRLMGAVGTLSLRAAPRGLAEIEVGLRGQLAARPDDVTAPSAPTYSTTNPEPMVRAKCYLGGQAIKFSQYQFSLGNDVQMPDDPSSEFGYGAAQHVNRRGTGRIDPAMSSIATRDAFSDWLDSTSQDLWINWGSAAGKRVSIYHPNVRPTGHEEGDVRGFLNEGIPFQSPEVNGSVFIWVW